jgi:hypothetical protein
MQVPARHELAKSAENLCAFTIHGVDARLLSARGRLSGRGWLAGSIKQPDLIHVGQKIIHRVLGVVRFNIEIPDVPVSRFGRGKLTPLPSGMRPDKGCEGGGAGINMSTAV